MFYGGVVGNYPSKKVFSSQITLKMNIKKVMISWPTHKKISGHETFEWG